MHSWINDCRLFGLITIMPRMLSRPFVAVAIICGTLEGKSILRANEQLGFGEFLTSENGQIQMGFDEFGILRVYDLKKKKSLWYPRATWWSSNYDGDDIYKPNYKSPFQLSFFNVDNPHGIWGSFQDTKEATSQPVKRGPEARSLAIKGYQLYVRDSKGKAIWHTEPTPYTDADVPGVYTAPKYAEHSVTTSWLYLDNTGRAMLMGVDETQPENQQTPFIIWCSCPYCLPMTPLKLDHYAAPDHKWRPNVTTSEYLFRATDGMLSHAETIKYYKGQDRCPAAPPPAAPDIRPCQIQ